MKIHQVSQHVFHLSKKFPDAPSSLTALVTDEGVVLVDTGSAEMAEDLRAAVASWGFGKPAYIISTHEHTDHIGC
ncbi:MAG: MBL fold metallo-hydrolase, partial [Candidatus Atribacteria bacterium]